MLQRFSAIFLCLCVAVQLAACGAPSADAQPSAPAPSPAVVETPTPTPSPTPEPVLEDPEAYFDNTLFVGDSIMEGIRQYVAKHRGVEPTLEGATFLTAVDGIGIATLVQGGTYRYNGESQPLAQIVAQQAPKRIFLLLGLNDLADLDPVVDEIVASYAQLIEMLAQAAPGAEIVVMTNPPKVASKWLPDYTPNRNFGNGLIDEFVEALTQMCDEQGVPYVDIHEALSDENGSLPDDFCRDGFLHLSDAGSAVVVEALEQFAVERCSQ